MEQRCVLLGDAVEDVKIEDDLLLVWPANRCARYPNLRISFQMKHHPIRIPAEYHEMDLPKGLIRLVDHWKDLVEEAKKTYEHQWYEKNARLEFLWFDEYYEVNTETFGINDELFCSVSVRMEEELEDLGCPCFAYMGSLD